MGADRMRLATQDDKPELFRMGKEFYLHSGYQDKGEFNETILDSVFDQLISGECLLIADGGMIGWLVFPVFMTGTLVAQELFWWVDEDKRDSGLGRELLKAAEEKAKNQGANSMIMICLDELEPDKAEAIYGKMGYQPRERTFMRTL